MTTLKIESLKQAEGRGSLARVSKNKDGADIIIDFWHDVVRLDVVKLEAVMKVAATGSEYDLAGFIANIEYQGFDRSYYIGYCLSKMSVSIFVRFAILGAIRGSNFARIQETCEQVPADLIGAFSSLGFVKTPKKKDHLTILRCTASIPHWCAYHLNKAGVAKKVPAFDCPASLQFPGAASLPMSRTVRLQHIAFCVAFSAMLPGGSFSLSIYITAMSNLIPVSDIPAEVLAIVGVSSQSESYQLTEDDKKPHLAPVALRK